jgi:tetratricopeptide (TPR) repeat protein
MEENWDLKILLLGAFEIYKGDQMVPKFPTQKMQSLLAYLATHRETSHSREILAEQFWGEVGADRARSNFRHALHFLRQMVGSYLLIDRHQLRFDIQGACWLDVKEFEDLIVQSREIMGEERFQALRRALELYRGDFLPGFYDDWVLAEEIRIKSLYQEAAETLTLWPNGPFEGALPLEKEREADLKLELATAHHRTKNLETAYALAEEAQRLYEYVQLPIKQARAYILMGSAQRHLGQYPPALDFYQLALILGRQTEDIRTQGRVFNNLGWLEWNLEHSQQAQGYYAQGLPLCRQIKDLGVEAQILNNWGIAHLDLEEYTQALERFAQAYEILSVSGDKELELENHSYRALAHLSLKDFNQVEQCVQQIMNLLQQGVGGRLTHKAHLNLWRVLQVTGYLKQARQHLDWAHQYVMTEIQKISDPTLRESSLKGNRTNREIVSAWQEEETR